MNGKLLATFPRSKDSWEAAKHTRLRYDVELTETLPAHFVISKRRKFVNVSLADRTDMGNPSLQWIGCGGAESSLDPTTAIVATHDDMRDLEYVYGVLQDRQAVLIVRAH